MCSLSYVCSEFNHTVEEALPEDQTALDQFPEDEIIDGLENGTLEITNRTLHELPSSGVHKCVGHLYEGVGGLTAISFYVVLETSSTTDTYQEGDGVYNRHSSGFLETVDDVVQTDDGSFVFTTLTQCSDVTTIADIETGPGLPDMTCVGGDMRPGVVFYDINPNIQLRQSSSAELLVLCLPR